MGEMLSVFNVINSRAIIYTYIHLYICVNLSFAFSLSLSIYIYIHISIHTLVRVVCFWHSQECHSCPHRYVFSFITASGSFQCVFSSLYITIPFIYFLMFPGITYSGIISLNTSRLYAVSRNALLIVIVIHTSYIRNVSVDCPCRIWATDNIKEYTLCREMVIGPPGKRLYFTRAPCKTEMTFWYQI